MATEKIKVDGVDLFIVPSGFVFVRQTCVKFYGKRISKHQLIKCCEHFISLLKLFYPVERLKIGFNLKFFKYYDLSVYLHGLISLYCSNIECSCPPCFGLFMFSHLPHDILVPEKPLLNLEYAVLHDTKGSDFVVCMADKPIYSRTIKGLEDQLSALSLKYRLHLILVNELPF